MFSVKWRIFEDYFLSWNFWNFLCFHILTSCCLKHEIPIVLSYKDTFSVYTILALFSLSMCFHVGNLFIGLWIKCYYRALSVKVKGWACMPVLGLGCSNCKGGVTITLQCIHFPQETIVSKNLKLWMNGIVWILNKIINEWMNEWITPRTSSISYMKQTWNCVQYDQQIFLRLD